MITEDAIHNALNGLKNVRWRETAFADLQWYYAEGGVYVLRCKKGDPNEHLCIIRAKSADKAISRAVFNLYKADDKKRIRRNCDVGTADEQTRRLRANCEKYKPSCKGCKFLTDIRHENCWLKWANAPYEAKEGGAE